MAWKSNQIWFAKIRDKKKIINKQNCRIDESSGIYIIFRIDKISNEHICYIGQAKNILERLAKHLLGYQAIDNSIRKHGIYDREKNPSGYQFGVVEHCEIEKLDAAEKYHISEYLKEGWILKNITAGGQIDKAGDLNERKQPKGYLDGLNQGYKNCLKDIKEFFDKYLDFVIKEPRLTKKKQPIVIKQKKYDEFKKLLSGETDELE